MARAATPNQLAALKLGAPVSAKRRAEIAAEGRAWARAWRAARKPYFDELYG